MSTPKYQPPTHTHTRTKDAKQKLKRFLEGGQNLVKIARDERKNRIQRRVVITASNTQCFKDGRNTYTASSPATQYLGYQKNEYFFSYLSHCYLHRRLSIIIIANIKGLTSTA